MRWWGRSTTTGSGPGSSEQRPQHPHVHPKHRLGETVFRCSTEYARDGDPWICMLEEGISVVPSSVSLAGYRSVRRELVKMSFREIWIHEVA